ncbi:MAG: NAD-dependent epimerase/dehydratase family protein [Hyphomonadaceae bacterium]|nr:NAD-dependent epimerase/dehydratase family protein [Hyphomonadaceae bacterium]
MRVLVTGAGGFIGGALAPALQAQGAQIIAVLRDDIPTCPIAADDVIVHLAGLAHARATEAQHRAANTDLTLALARRARDAGARRFVFASSIKAVGEQTFGTRFSETTRAEPLSAYGRSKLAAEQGLAQIEGLDWVALRPPLVHGPNAKANFGALLRLADTGLPLPFDALKNSRSLLSLPSAVEAFALAVFKDGPPGIFHVADAPTLSTARIVANLRAGLDRPKRLVRPGILRPLLGLKQVRMLTESLEIDDTRFRRAYGFNGADSNAALKATARAYAEARRAR